MEPDSNQGKPGEQQAQPKSRLQCKTCGKSFGRVEHLKRHVLSHTQERQYQCSHCKKQFMRRDAMQRHELTHQQSGPSLLQKGARACANCAAAKARCSGDQVCQRCTRRTLDCIYPDNGNPQSEQSFSTPEVVNYAPDDDAPDTNLGKISSNMSVPQDDQSQSLANQFSPTQQESYVIGQQNSGTGMNYNGDQFNNFPQEMDSYAPDTFDATGNMPNDIFDPNYWNPNILSTINWLSNDTQLPHIDSGQQNIYDPQFWDGFQPDLPIFAVPTTSTQAETSTPSQVYDTRSLDSLQHHTPQSPVTTLSGGSVGTSAQAETAHELGALYVDGDTARLPKMKRRRLTNKSTTKASTPMDKHFSLAFDWPIEPAKLGRPLPKITDQLYMKFRECFQIIQMVSSQSVQNTYQLLDHPITTTGQLGPVQSFSPSFSPHFPTKEVLEYLLALCADSFLPIFPILPTDYIPTSWQLLLALATIGSHYVEAEGIERFVNSMHEVLRQVIDRSDDDPNWLNMNDEVEIIQVKLLHSIGQLYSGDLRSFQNGLKRRHELAHFCDHHWQRKSGPHSELTDDNVKIEWEIWRREEIRRRTGYCIWLFDCQMSYHYQCKPMLTLEQATVQMPCHEKVWAAESAQTWKTMFTKYKAPSSLYTALERIYIDKNVAPESAEFNNILIIHGLYRRCWEVEAYYHQPLSQWTPTAEKESSSDLPASSAIWLPSIPTFTKWRNSTCDCLDVLHFNANATIGANTSQEHPTVLHLHTARVILLSPYTHIVNLAFHLAGEPSNLTEDAITFAKQQIRRWAVHDQYKARLSMIHAGVTYWHIRHFSTNAFYEPAAVGLATLALWAFSIFSNRAKQKTTEPSSDSDTDNSACDIVLLDRPTDDELVQLFVRRGDTMRANVSGVGDLYGEHAAERVLVQGRKILSSLRGWGIIETWLRVLDNLLLRSRRTAKPKMNGKAPQ